MGLNADLWSRPVRIDRSSDNAENVCAVTVPNNEGKR